MGAYLDHTGGGRFDFGWRKTQPKGIGGNGMRMFSRSLTGHRLNDQKRSWSVCPHLSSLEGLFDYYMASGSIMILLGKCFCHDCYKMVLSRRDLTEFMESCQHLTDMRFQKDFIDPLFQTNREVFRTRRNYTIEESTQWTWVSCPHVSREGQLEGLYTKCNPIFFNEGFVTCNDCRDVIPSASLPASIGRRESGASTACQK